MQHLRLGKYGERLAKKFLKKKGFKILERNYRTKFGEIDIIARDGSQLVFIEVKTRSSQSFGSPQEALTLWKLERLRRAVQIYCIQKNIQKHGVRMDAVSVEIGQSRSDIKITHFRNITM